MGGIFCATARDNVVPSVMHGLADLEHWGCDSAGLAVLTDRQIQRRRATGPLSSLETLLADEPVVATTVLGHIRSATHGKPSRHNAHPHASARVAVVHNGIIENHAELRAELEREGVQFRSDTDSEVIVWLLDRELASRAHPLAALRTVLPRLQGSFALGVICTQHDDCVYGARRGSPLAAARTGGASWLAPDPAVLGRFASEFVSLEEEQIVRLCPGQVRIFDPQLERVVPRWIPIVSPAKMRKSGRVVTDFARQEIVDLPGIVGRTVLELERDMASGELESWCGPLWRADRILAIGSGSSYHAAHVARAWLEQIAGIPVEIELSSELKSRDVILTEGTMALLVSQSDEDADTLEALRYLRQRNVPTVALVNVASSALAREADTALDYRSGREVGIPSSNAFTALLCALAAASIVIRQQQNRAPQGDGITASIFRVPQAMESALELEDQCVAVGRRIAEANRGTYLGRGMSYPLALAGAFTLEALADVHADGLAGGELKHRPSALTEPGVPVVIVAPHDETFDSTLSDLREVIARGGDPVLLGDSHTALVAKRDGLSCIETSRVDPLWSPLVLAVPLQMIAYHAARASELSSSPARELDDAAALE